MDLKDTAHMHSENGSDKKIDKQYQRRNAECKQWSAQQLDMLVEAQKHFGNNWKKIANMYFPDRNANQIKCKFTYLRNKMTCPVNMQKRKNQDYVNSMIQNDQSSFAHSTTTHDSTGYKIYQMNEEQRQDQSVVRINLSTNAPVQKQMMSVDSSVNVNNPVPDTTVIYKVLDTSYFEKYEDDLMNSQDDVFMFDQASFNDYFEMMYINQ